MKSRDRSRSGVAEREGARERKTITYITRRVSTPYIIASRSNSEMMSRCAAVVAEA